MTQLNPDRWRALAVVLLATFMVLLDTSIVNNGIPSIQRDLAASNSQIQLVLDAYLLAYAALLITGGRLGDIFGRRRMFLLGVIGFSLSSALCGLAPTANALIAFRVVQGLTAAMLVPQVSAMIQVEFGTEERGTAFGFLGAVIGLATISGPLLGGLLIGANFANLGWRPIFLINLPIGLIALVGASRLVRESRSPHARKLDLGGVALLSVALLLIVYPIVEGRTQGWPIWLLSLAALGVVMLALFVLDQKRKASRGAAPLVDPALFRDRAFRLGLPISLIFFTGVYSFFLALAICLQAGFGRTPLGSALATMPFQSATLVMSLLSARLARRMGARILVLGGALLVTGVIGVIFTLAREGALLVDWSLLPALIIGGAGFGLVIGPLTTIILSGVQPTMAASASGVLSTAQQIGGALGIAVVGTLLFGQLETADQSLNMVERFSHATQVALRFHVVAFAITLGLFVLLAATLRTRSRQPTTTEAADVVPATVEL